MGTATLDLLLTGATGFLGHYVLAELMRVGDVRCRVLLRPPIERGRARLVRCLHDLGLDADALIAGGRIVPVSGELPHRLDAGDLKGVRTIVHAAASTSFDAVPSGEPARTNVEGTRALLSLADALRVRRFVFVSTAYVCGHRTGRIPERVMVEPPPSCNAYEHTKWQAEQLVWRWRTGGRTATICRPSILFGDRETGRATTMAGVYVIARATELLSRAVADDPDIDRHRVPLRVLGRADATCNIVPVCWASRCIADIVRERDRHDRVHHITNPHPPTHADIKAWLEAYFDIAGGTFSDSGWPLRNPNHYEDLFYSLGNILRDYFRHGLEFQSGVADDVRRGPPVVDRDYFHRCLDYAIATNWGRAARQPSTRPAPPQRTAPRRTPPPQPLPKRPMRPSTPTPSTHSPPVVAPHTVTPESMAPRAAAHAPAAQATAPPPTARHATPDGAPPSAIDPAWYFETFLRDVVPRSTIARIEALTTTVRFVITGHTPGEWVCRFERGRLADVHAGPGRGGEDFGYRIPYDGFQDAVTGRTPLQALFFQHRADMFGRIDLALKMVSIMRAFLDEFPADAGASP